METIQNLIFNPQANAVGKLNSHLENVSLEKENLNNILNEIIKFFSDNSNKYINNNENWIETINNFINNYYKYVNSLNQEQLLALIHLSFSMFILSCIINIISTLFSDFLINYLN